MGRLLGFFRKILRMANDADPEDQTQREAERSHSSGTPISLDPGEFDPDRPIPPFNDEPKFVIAADQLSEGVGVRSFKSVFRRTFAEYTPSRDRFVETL